MPNGESTAELTRRINPIRPVRVNPPRRGKIHEWAEQAEMLTAWWTDISPAITAIALFIILVAIAATK